MMWGIPLAASSCSLHCLNVWKDGTEMVLSKTDFLTFEQEAAFLRAGFSDVLCSRWW